MEYKDFINEITGLGFMNDETAADAAILAVLGMFTRMFGDEKAKAIADSLPAPLAFDRLVGFRKAPAFIPFHDCVTEIAVRFGLTYYQAVKLTKTVLRLAKQAVGEKALKDCYAEMPPDWSDAIRTAA